VRDLEKETTTLVGPTAGSINDSNSPSGPALSADGRFVAFLSKAGGLAPNDTDGGYDVFVHDMQTGTTVMASASW